MSSELEIPPRSFCPPGILLPSTSISMHFLCWENYMTCVAILALVLNDTVPKAPRLEMGSVHQQCNWHSSWGLVMREYMLKFACLTRVLQQWIWGLGLHPWRPTQLTLVCGPQFALPFFIRLFWKSDSGVERLIKVEWHHWFLTWNHIFTLEQSFLSLLETVWGLVAFEEQELILRMSCRVFSTSWMEGSVSSL